MAILFKNARILTLKDSKIFEGDLLVDNDKIINISKSISKKKNYQIIDCNKNLLMPSFKNMHTHSGMSFLRSYADDMKLEDWLHNFVEPMESCFKENDIYYLTKLSILEYISNGITTVSDMYFDGSETMKALNEYGLKGNIIYMWDIKKLSYLEAYHKYSSQDKKNLLKLAMGLHAIYSSSDERIKAMSKLIHDLKIPFYVHAHETIKEVDDCIKNHKMTPIQYFNKFGLFDYGGAIYHGVYLSKKDINILKNKKVTVVTCPASNLKLASGIADIKKLLENDINVCIGTDGPASNNSLDMFKEMFLVSTLSKIKNNDPISIKPFDILKMACCNSNKLLKENNDILEIGKKADIIMIDLDKPEMQPINNVVSNLVYSGNKSLIKLTMSNGKILYMNGKYYLKDEPNDIFKYANLITQRLKKEGNKKLNIK